MARESEDDLICDFAEHYHVYNWRQLPPRTAAALAVGLPRSSRTMIRRMGEDVDLDTVLLAAICDQLRLLRYELFGKKGSRQPALMTTMIMKEIQKQQQRGQPAKIRSFSDRAAFDAWYSSITGKEGE